MPTEEVVLLSSPCSILLDSFYSQQRTEHCIDDIGFCCTLQVFNRFMARYQVAFGQPLYTSEYIDWKTHTHTPHTESPVAFCCWRTHNIHALYKTKKKWKKFVQKIGCQDCLQISSSAQKWFRLYLFLSCSIRLTYSVLTYMACHAYKWIYEIDYHSILI